MWRLRIRLSRDLTTSEALEIAKQRLTSLTTRLRRYIREADAKKINALCFKESSKVSFQLECNNIVAAEPPRNWTMLEEYMGEREDITPVQSGCRTWEQTQQSPRTGTGCCHSSRIQQQVRTWRAGRHLVQTWCTSSGQDGSHPDWLTQGERLMIMKDSHKGTTWPNYGPIITCLPQHWKVLSGIIDTRIQDHMDQYMSIAQKGIENNTRGSKYQLIIDRAVVQDSLDRAAVQVWA